MSTIPLPTTAVTSARLPLGLKVFFAIGSLGFTLLISAISFFLLFFYTDVALVPPALAGSALLVGRIWDTINDPLVGWFSDRTRSRWGRRRVYLIYGALPLALTAITLWVMPRGLSPALAFVWIVVTYTLFDTFFTLTNMPFGALTAELTQDYDERTSLTAASSVGAVVGYIAGGIVMRAIVGRFADPGFGYLVAGVVLGAVVGACVGLVAWRVREPAHVQARTPSGSLFTGLRATLRNRPFVTLVIAFSLARLSFTILSTVLAYFVTYQLRAPDRLTSLLSVLLIVIGLFIFAWKWLSDRWSKGAAYAAGLLITALAVGGSFFVGPGQVGGMYVVMAVAGFGLAAHWVIPWAMLPDVVEYDEAATGQRRVGMYYGVAGLADKLMRTLGVGLVGWVLEWFGYVPNVEQTAQSLLGIRLLFGPVSAVLLALALPLLFAYPITRASHARLREQLAQPAPAERVETALASD